MPSSVRVSSWDQRATEPFVTAGKSQSEVWATHAWRMEAVAWADEKLAAVGMTRTGPVDQVRIRPWSTLLHIPVDKSIVLMKAPYPGGSHEGPLLEILAKHVPDTVLKPLAVDKARGWMLLPKAGSTFKDLVEPDELLGVWRQVVDVLGSLQRTMESKMGEMVDADVPELLPDAQPDVLRDTLTSMDGSAEWDQDFDDACQRLTVGPVPFSIQHDDLHLGNIFAGQGGIGDPVFFDWGDAYIGHPFSTMLVVTDVIAEARPGDRDAIRGTCELYLDHWSDLASREELRRLLSDAIHVGKLGRALVWERVKRVAKEEEIAVWGDPVTEWLNRLAEPVEIW